MLGRHCWPRNSKWDIEKSLLAVTPFHGTDARISLAIDGLGSVTPGVCTRLTRLAVGEYRLDSSCTWNRRRGHVPQTDLVLRLVGCDPGIETCNRGTERRCDVVKLRLNRCGCVCW
eukprot:2487229-Rhodomonas_salina.3